MMFWCVQGLQVASCLTIAADGIGKDGKMVARPYTPCSRPDTKGVVDFVIKEYPAPNGIMSRHLCSLKPGDSIKMKGPWKKLKYEAGMKRLKALIRATGKPWDQLIEIKDHEAYGEYATITGAVKGESALDAHKALHKK